MLSAEITVLTRQSWGQFSQWGQLPDFSSDGMAVSCLLNSVLGMTYYRQCHILYVGSFYRMRCYISNRHTGGSVKNSRS